MTLGEKLKKARLDRGLTQTQVCGERITRNMLSQLENDSASPSVRTLEYLADALGVSMGWLLEQDPAAEQLQQARQLFRQRDFSACFDALCDHPAGRTEEGLLILIRSALFLSEAALADGRFREAYDMAETELQKKHVATSRLPVTYLDLFCIEHDKSKMTEEEQKAYEGACEQFRRDKVEAGLFYNIYTANNRMR